MLAPPTIKRRLIGRGSLLLREPTEHAPGSPETPGLDDKQERRPRLLLFTEAVA